MDGIWGLYDIRIASNLNEIIGTSKMDISFQSKEKELQKECIGGAHQILLWDRMPGQHTYSNFDRFIYIEDNSATIRSYN